VLSSGPRAIFLLAETQKLKLPVGATIPPQEEEHFEGVTGEELERRDEKTNFPRRNRKLEGAVSKPRDKN